MELQGRVALVTGAAQGLGLAAAGIFAREGARVVLNDIKVDAVHAAASALGPTHLAIGGDVAEEAQVRDMVRVAIERMGAIDILVNNAGIPDIVEPTVDQSYSHWKRLIDVHLSGTYLMSKAVAPSMIERRSGAMLNVNSIAGVLGLPMRTSYSAAKAGIGMLTRVLGCEWAPYGIRVNAIAPGYIRTAMTQGLIDEGRIDENRIRRRTPMGAMGTADDVAEAMLFLASDRAKFITGVTLPVDGGYCAWGAPSDAYPLE